MSKLQMFETVERTELPSSPTMFNLASPANRKQRRAAHKIQAKRATAERLKPTRSTT